MSKVIQRMVLVFVVVFAAASHAQNYIAYESNTDEMHLKGIITSKYMKRVNHCRNGQYGKYCTWDEIVPPGSPEIWYFLNDNQPEFIKFIASNNNGKLKIIGSSLTAREKSASDEAKAVRAEVKESWKAFEAEFSPSVDKSKSYPKYKITEDCGANGFLESEDSPFDYFSNKDFRNLLKDRVMAHHPVTSSGPKVNSVNVSVGAVSFGVSWNTAATMGTATMGDGGTLVFYLDTSNNINTPVLHLQHSRTASGHRLSDYLTPVGNPLNDLFKPAPGTHKFTNNCEAQEFEEAVEAIKPEAFQEQPGGASGGSHGFGSCEAGSMTNLMIITTVSYSVYSSGHVVFHYHQSYQTDRTGGGGGC
ncbi:hypothetical protein [Aliikangiella coralliicola]|uniref:Uncharacterized protein n=1 Tax=Aliikangiella coralliicola TaxID=2592383 RepID=A0A545UID3_9GAMM|nr:hypothetical protein [Aliikangiella coralliicola]TQV89193.1 hypothetical protein FLL46_03435 [Aliikangiella coralliicola]